jgi:multidrug efflux pump subunit AcrA (membrane-fusion protein)
MKKLLWVIIIVLALWGLYAWNKDSKKSTGGETATATVETEEADYVLVVGDQKAGKEVLVSSATLVAPGYVAVHRSVNEAPGKIIGTSALLQSGKIDNLAVALTEAVKAGDKLFVMVHADNGDGTADLSGVDVPATRKDTSVVMSMVQVMEGVAPTTTGTSTAR